jgi:hypothetical protein
VTLSKLLFELAGELGRQNKRGWMHLPVPNYQGLADFFHVPLF